MSTPYVERATTSNFYPAAETNQGGPNLRHLTDSRVIGAQRLSGNVVNCLLHFSDLAPPRP